MLDDQRVSISNMARQLNMRLQLVAQNMPLNVPLQLVALEAM